MKKIVFALVLLVASQAIYSKSLVAYFSATGTTKAAAEKLAAEHGSELWRILEFEPYTEADLDWRNPECRTRKEAADTFERPMIKICTWIEPYDTIYLGFPIWWYVAPTIINTFLESYNFAGKKIVLFATSGGSGFGNAARELKASAPGAEIIEGKLLNRATDKDIDALIKLL